jgi:hypothetical protein
MLMRRVQLFATAIVMVQAVDVRATVLAGSTMESPPPFLPDSFWDLTPSVDRAFPFQLIPGGPYLVEELQIAAFHYEGLTGDTAEFSIRTDDNGFPGSEIATFAVEGITTTEQVITVPVLEHSVLDSGTTYWLVGSTLQQQVNWNLGDDAFGPGAYQVEGQEWVLLRQTNTSAYAILGSAVPEPSSAVLLACLIFLTAGRGRGG